MIDRPFIQLCGVPEEFISEVMAGIEGKGSSLNYMALGAAFANRQGLVDSLIAQGTSKHWALRGAAYGNHEELVNKLIEQGASKGSAMKGAGEGNHEELVNKLIEQGASKDRAVRGAKSVGNKELVLKLTGSLPSSKPSAPVTGLDALASCALFPDNSNQKRRDREELDEEELQDKKPRC